MRTHRGFGGRDVEKRLPGEGDVVGLEPSARHHRLQAEPPRQELAQLWKHQHAQRHRRRRAPSVILLLLLRSSSRGGRFAIGRLLFLLPLLLFLPLRLLRRGRSRRLLRFVEHHLPKEEQVILRVVADGLGLAEPERNLVHHLQPLRRHGVRLRLRGVLLRGQQPVRGQRELLRGGDALAPCFLEGL